MKSANTLTTPGQSWLESIEKEPFPVVYSSLEPQALSSLILRHYEVDIPKECRFWHRGLSDVYLVETLSALYILRVSHHHWRSKLEIEFELELLDFLAEQGIPVSAPLRTRRNSRFVEINAPEGKRYASLFPYAAGGIALGDLNLTQSNLLGQVVAQLHQTVSQFRSLASRPSLTPEYLLDNSLQSIAPFLYHRHHDLKFLVETIADLKQELARLPLHSPYWCICWGDPHSGNVHFTADNQLTLFDFDQCGYGWRVFDIAKFLQVSLQTGLSRSIRESFIRGYQSLTPLSRIEIDSLHALTQTAYIWSWAIILNATKMHDYSRLDHYYFTQRLEKLRHLKSRDWELF